MSEPSQRRAVRKAEIDRALKAATDAGLHIAALEIAPDGTIRVLTSPPQLTEEQQAEAALAEFEREWDRHEAESKAKVRAALEIATRRLDRALLASVYKDTEYRSSTVLERVLAITRFQLDDAQRFGLVEARPGGGRPMYSQASILKALGAVE